MIKLLREGHYNLIETKNQTKILILDGEKRNVFAWINAAEIGEILVTSHKSHKIDHILSLGRYRMYQVKDEPDLTDLIHLELHTGEGIWQGYLLPNALPTDDRKRGRIIPTREIITRSVL